MDTRAPALILAILLAGPALGACPDDLGDCLGSAASFDLVGEKVTVGRGLICDDGCGPVPSITGDACASKAVVGGPNVGFTARTQLDSLVGWGTTPTPVTFVDTTNNSGIGIRVLGDVVTSGGTVRGQDNAIIDGVVDVSGTDPRVATCASALGEARTGSDALAALAPTDPLAAIDLQADEFLQFTAGPGVNVVQVPEIKLRSRTPRYDQPIYSAFGVVLDPATQAVVINTQKVTVEDWSYIWVDGDPTKVVINVAGGGRVFFGVEAVVDPIVLAPRSNVGFHFGHARRAIGRRVLMRGGCVGVVSHAYCHVF